MREYFSHDYNARNDKKLVKLFMQHGLNGIGAFWCLIEMLYESNGNVMLSECERIAFELRCDVDFIKSIINDFDLFKNDDIKFWSTSVNDRLLLRNAKSAKARASALARWESKEDDANALRTQSEGNAIKVNKSKVNKSKEEEIYTFQAFWDLYGKKQDKDKCIKRWEKLDSQEKAKAMGAIPAYVNSTPDLKFRKNPLTWLNGKCWDDEINFSLSQNTKPTTTTKKPNIVTKTSYDDFKFD